MSLDLKLRRRDWLALGAGALVAPFPLTTLAALARPGANLLVEGIPPFERTTLAETGQASALRFVDWHPQRAEMLVLKRHGVSQQLHRVTGPGAEPEPLTEGRDAVTDGAWEPSHGDYLVFARDPGGSEAHRLYRLGEDGRLSGAPIALTPPGERVSDFEILPDGLGLVYLQERLDKRPPGVTGSDDPPEDDDEPAAPRLADEPPAPADADAAVGALSRVWWTDPLRPGERRLLGDSERGRYTALRISPAGRVLATLTVDGRSRTVRFPVPRGDAAAAQPAARDLTWRRQAIQGEFRHLVRVDARGGTRSLLTEVPADLEGLAVPATVEAGVDAAADRPLALVYNVDGVSELRLYRDGDEQAAPVAMAGAPGVIRTLRWHPRLPLLGFDQVSADSPGQLFALSLEDGQARVRPWSDAAERSSLRSAVVRWTGFDGLPLSGLHIAPPARFTGPRPVFVSLHGGPSSQARPGYLSGVMRALVERLGMHVLMPNVRGSDGFGKRFLTLDNGRLRENAVRDVGGLLDWVATRTDMDAGRAVVAGGSYGGYLSLAVAVHESPRIAGSICRVGIADFVGLLEHTESYRRDNRRLEYGDERDPAMRAFLTSISPLTHADAVKKPLMVVHGRNDPRVPFAQARAMVDAVRAGGTPVWFLSATDEGHSFTKADNVAYLNQASFEFVRRLVHGEGMT